MDLTRGSTTLGSGALNSYVYLPRDAFDVDYFSEIHVTLSGDHTAYSDAFNSLMEEMAETLEPHLDPLIMDRYHQLKKDAEAEYAKGYGEYSDGYNEYMQGMKDAYDELQGAFIQLQTGQNEIDENRKKLDDGFKELEKAQKELDTQRNTLTKSKTELLAAKSEALAQLAQANAELMEQYKLVSPAYKQVDDGMKQLDDGIAQLEDGLAQIADGIQQLQTLIDVLDISLGLAKDSLAALEGNPLTAPEDLAAARSRVEEIQGKRDEYVNQRNELQGKQTEYSSQLEDLKNQRESLYKTWKELDSAMSAIEDGMLELQSRQTQANNQFAAMEAQIQSGEIQLQAAQDLLNEKADELKEARQTLDQAQTDLDAGWDEYHSGSDEADAELLEAWQTLTDARQELADARKTIDEMDPPELYILDRNTVPGYTSLDSNSDIVAGVAKVFPAFFLAVAALVCITTMTRMVDEERTQIGILKAMGYSSRSIISKYMYYAGSAALLGCGLGVLAGSVVFPMILWDAFCIMFNVMPWVVLKLNWPLCLAVVLAYTLVMLFVTWYSCRRELKEVPAELIRPKPPTSGKKIFLEYLPFWRKLSFLNKVMLRNVFRYRQRLLMMLLGIGGCTALLLTGFGIKDSLTTVIDVQFSNVTVYDMEIYFKDGLSQKEQEEFIEEIRGKTDRIGFFYQSSVEIDFEGQTREVILRVDDSGIKNFVQFQMDGQTLSMPGVGETFLSVGTAEQLGIHVGDTITVRNADMQSLSLRVAGIFENHVSNFMVVLPQTIQEQWGYTPAEQMAFATVRDYQDAHETASAISQWKGVLNVLVTQDTANSINGTMDALLLVVTTIVICASLLAIIVLYNLTNINITERLREIATIKVLGFTSSETSAYVFKENVLLSVMGSACGLVFGVWLLDFVISCIKIDMVWFKTQLTFPSYVWAVIITMISALAVDFIFHFKLQKINMAEALKSVE
jgi:putative ABC transport system permease protein